MSLPVVKRSNVDHELGDFYFYIAQDKFAPAERFLEVAEESFERLAELPSLGRPLESRRPKLAGIRVYPMPSPYRSYLILYRLLADAIEIIAVIHGARDFEAILERLM